MPKLELVAAKAQMVKSLEEYYNSIRTNIQFSGRNYKIITLTSAQPGEGKSTTSMNIAISFAKAGFRTLLIDADTRNSVISGTFRSDERYQGLTSYLSGNAELSDVICETTIPNLMVIPAGQAAPNPTSLLQNNQFQTMIDMVRSLYDYVIIDTPPLGLVIDAAILAHYSDASLLVTKAGEDRRRTITKLKEQLEQSGAVFLGVILNQYDVTTDTYGHYRSYGDYGNYGKAKEETSKNRRRKKKQFLLEQSRVDMYSEDSKKKIYYFLSDVFAVIVSYLVLVTCYPYQFFNSKFFAILFWGLVIAVNVLTDEYSYINNRGYLQELRSSIIFGTRVLVLFTFVLILGKVRFIQDISQMSYAFCFTFR